MPEADGIEAERLVRSDQEAVFDFLCDLENHWDLADRFVEVLELSRDGPGRPVRGGRVRMRGPLGLGRTAVTRVAEVEPYRRIAGTAEVGQRTVARVSWTLHPDGDGTCVRLGATLEHASLLDRALLAAGGARWLRRHFATILATLDDRVAASVRD